MLFRSDASGSCVVTGSDDCTVRLWSARDGRLQLTLRGFTHYIVRLALSPDNAAVAAVTNDGGPAPVVRHYDNVPLFPKHFRP